MSFKNDAYKTAKHFFELGWRTYHLHAPVQINVPEEEKDALVQTEFDKWIKQLYNDYAEDN